MRRSRGTKWMAGAGGGAAALLAGIFFWCVPPFHVLKLTASRKAGAAAEFNAGTFVDALWNGPLAHAPERAVDAPLLLAAIDKDPKAARQKYGRSVGLGNSYFFFLKGDGRVVAADDQSISLALRATGTADVVLQTGNIFGDALRDGTGLVNVSDFPNSQDFNAISSELNSRIEQRVLPPLRQHASLGKTVQFSGCAEVVDEAVDLHPLHVVPLTAAVR